MTEKYPVAPHTTRRAVLSAALTLGTVWLAGCAPQHAEPEALSPAPSPTPASSSPRPSPSEAAAAVPLSREEAIERFASQPSGNFGLDVAGIELKLPSSMAAVALTFDACGGAHGSGYDERLIDTLREHQVPATLFINQRWARTNTGAMSELVADPLFEIANHGTSHAPLASGGQAAYGIPGTASIAQAYDEVMENQHYLWGEFGIQARFFRSGTAHMDELSASMTRALGLIPVNFSVNLDAGATFPATTVAAQLGSLRTGDIGIGHFNQPDSHTAAGVSKALDALLSSLQDQGLRPVQLGEVPKF